MKNILAVDDKIMWDIWMSAYYIPVVSVADELGLFRILKNKSAHPKHLAKELAISVDGTKVLINVLIGLKILTYKDSKVSLNLTSKSYLLQDSPSYWGPQLHGYRDRSEHKSLMKALTSSATQLSFDNNTFSDMWKNNSLSEAAAKDFTQKMNATILTSSLSAIKSGVFSATKKLLDMGGGSGCFSIAFTKQYSKRQAAIYELPAVCNEAQNYLIEANAQRVKVLTGNFFQDRWPAGYDGILFSQIFHDWPLENCKKLAEYAYAALPKGGKIYVHEMLLDKNEITPLTVSCFNLLMFINHKSQQFTKKQLFKLLHSVGFKKLTFKKTFGYYSVTSGTKI